MRKKSGTRARVLAEQQELQIGPTELGNKTQNEFDYPKQKEGKSVCVCVCVGVRFCCVLTLTAGDVMAVVVVVSSVQRVPCSLLLVISLSPSHHIKVSPLPKP